MRTARLSMEGKRTGFSVAALSEIDVEIQGRAAAARRSEKPRGRSFDLAPRRRKVNISLACDAMMAISMHRKPPQRIASHRSQSLMNCTSPIRWSILSLLALAIVALATVRAPPMVRGTICRAACGRCRRRGSTCRRPIAGIGARPEGPRRVAGAIGRAQGSADVAQCCPTCKCCRRRFTMRSSIMNSSKRPTLLEPRACSRRAARAEQLLAGHAPWDTATGLVVRGYVSRIDGSVQPYGLVVPESYAPAGPVRHPLDIWFHGRGETLSEVNFLDERHDSRRRIHAARHDRASSLWPVLQCLQVRRRDRRARSARVGQAALSRSMTNRIAVRGFSMGGAACWHFAVHYPDRWVAANPGAGFAETPEFLKRVPARRDPAHRVRAEAAASLRLHRLGRQSVTTARPWPTAARSTRRSKPPTSWPRRSKRKGSAGATSSARTKHMYHPEAKKTVERLHGRASPIAGASRCPPHDPFRAPTHSATTEIDWVTIDGLDEHWEQARARTDYRRAASAITTANIAGLTFHVPAGWLPGTWLRCLDAGEADDRRSGNRCAAALVRSLLELPGPQTRTAIAGRWARCPIRNHASITACRGRSTMRSWIRSCSCGRRGRRSNRRSKHGSRAKWNARSMSGGGNSAARPA